MRLNKSELGLQ